MILFSKSWQRGNTIRGISVYIPLTLYQFYKLLMWVIVALFSFTIMLPSILLAWFASTIFSALGESFWAWFIPAALVVGFVMSESGAFVRYQRAIKQLQDIYQSDPLMFEQYEREMGL